MALIVKPNSAILAAVGAKSENDFDAAFAALLEGFKASGKTSADAIAKLTADLEAVTKLNGELSASLKTATEKIATIEASVGNALTEAQVRDLANVAGSKAATDALGAVGAAVPPAAPSNAAPNANGASAVDGLVAAGKYDEAFAADKNLQAEFITAESFKAFKLAEKRGMVGKNYVK